MTAKRITNAVRRLRCDFPFPGYTEKLEDSYLTVAGAVCRLLPEGSRILDFASGPCDKTAVLASLGYQCWACDDLRDEWHLFPGVADQIVEFARAQGVHFRRVTGAPAKLYAPEWFDMVMLHDIVEHLHESPRQLLNDLLSLVKPGGYLFVTVPNAANIWKRLRVLSGGTNYPRFEAYYWCSGQWRGHVREYVRSDVERLASLLGVEAVELRSCHNRLHSLPKLLRPAFRLATRVFPGWRDTWLLIARKTPGWQPRTELDAPGRQRIMARETPFRYDAAAAMEHAAANRGEALAGAPR